MGSLEMEGSDEFGGIAKRMWNKSRNERALALYSPYVVCLGSGNLDPDSFLHCISQDVYFLRAFAQAYELAEEYADDDEDKEAIVTLRKRVLKRLKNQDALISEWGFEPPKETARGYSTAKYTEFLMETASGKVGGEKHSVNIVTPFEKTKLAAYTLSAISPCMRLYTFISKEIQAILGPEKSDHHHVYKKWLNSLSSLKFEASASRIEDLLDKLSVCLTGEELDVVERLYERAMRLELDFIWSQPVIQQTIVPFSRCLHHNNKAEGNLIVFCDFDLTCTAIDSSALLAELAIVAASDVSESADIRTSWNELFGQYVDEYQQCIDSIMPVEAVIDKSLNEGGLDYGGLCKALERISEVEKSATLRMICSDVLKGLNLAEIRRAGECLAFQEGCKRFFKDLMTESKNPAKDVHVLSYCWSGDLIKSAFSSGDEITLNVHSNDLIYEKSVSTGNMITNMESPMDKLRAFNEIIKSDSNNGVKPSTVYIGGSVGDLLCLLEADVGIVIGSSTSLMKLGNHFGVSFVPLFPGLVSKQRELAESGTLNRKGDEITLNVHSNDLIYEKSISTGNMITNMESPMDKLRAFNEITKTDSNNGVKPSTVYIGGSVGDLLCLLEADVSIVIGSSTSRMMLGNHFGVSFVPLFPGLVSKQRELAESGTLNRKGTSDVIYTVSNWDEIYAFVLGQ